MASATGGSELDFLAVALDTPDRRTFSKWCRLFGPRVGILKVGLEAFARWGPPAVREAREFGNRVFLDLKLHDIPNTVHGAVSAARDMGVDYLTVHAGGGPAMLAAACEAGGEELGILGVTLLTHLDEGALTALDLGPDAGSRIERWAELVAQAGCRGAVCSPLEVSALRACHPRPFQLVTPGIRPEPQAGDDQRRAATPENARRAGADILVVGRPLTRAADPLAALDALASRLDRQGAT